MKSLLQFGHPSVQKLTFTAVMWTSHTGLSVLLQSGMMGITHVEKKRVRRLLNMTELNRRNLEHTHKKKKNAEMMSFDLGKCTFRL